MLTMLHHIATGIRSFGHSIQPSHCNRAMDIGVVRNPILVSLGAVIL